MVFTYIRGYLEYVAPCEEKQDFLKFKHAIVVVLNKFLKIIKIFLIPRVLPLYELPCNIRTMIRAEIYPF